MSQVSVEEAFVKHGVVTDVLPKTPKNLLKVAYENGVDVNLGGVLTPTQVKNEPKIDWDADSSTLYTVVMTDPDAPSRANPIRGEWRHWLIINVKGKDLSSGKTISQYVGAGPPPSTGLHRYVFLIYKQGNEITDDIPVQSNKIAKGRESFKVADFAKKYNLGDPLFGNFFQAEHDDYVPILYAQFTD